RRPDLEPVVLRLHARGRLDPTQGPQLRYAVGAPKMPDHGLVAAAVAVVPCEEVIDSAGLHRPALAGQTRVLGGLEDRPDRVLVAVRGRRLKRRSEEHTSELQSRENLVCRLLLEKKKQTNKTA